MGRFFIVFIAVCAGSFLAWRTLKTYSEKRIITVLPHEQFKRRFYPILNLTNITPASQPKNLDAFFASYPDWVFKVPVIFQKVDNGNPFDRKPAVQLKDVTGKFNQIPLTSFLKSFSKASFLLDIQDPGHEGGEAVARALIEADAWKHVWIYSASPNIANEIRRWLQPNPLKNVPMDQPFPEKPLPQPTSNIDPVFLSSYDDILRALFLDSVGLLGFYSTRAHALIIPNNQLKYEKLSQGFIDTLHKMGKKIILEEPTDSTMTRKLILSGVDGLIFSSPEMLQKILTEELPQAM